MAPGFHIPDQFPILDLYLIFDVVAGRGPDHSELAIFEGLKDEPCDLHQNRMITAKILGEKYITDGKAADTPGFIPDMSAEIFYEVVRLIDGKFLFLDDHLDRLSHSLSSSGIPSPGNDVIRENLRLLQINNQFKEGNIRICIQRNRNGDSHLLCYFIPYFYPETCMYKSGVQLMTFPHIRPNPGIKKWDDQFRVSVNQFIRDQGIYEAILLNDRKQITEGSRSNIFFINHQSRLVSAPENEIIRSQEAQIDEPESARIFLPSSTLVPSSLATTGTLTPGAWSHA